MIFGLVVTGKGIFEIISLHIGMIDTQDDHTEASERTNKERRRRRREKLTERRNRKTWDLSRNSSLSIRNFRPVSGFGGPAKIYRCGSTDVLGTRIRYNQLSANNRRLRNYEPSKADILVQRDAGLIIDLRSASERKEEDAILWMNEVSNLLERTNGRFEKRRKIRVLTIPLGKENNESSITTMGHDESVNIGRIFGEEEVDNIRYVIRLDVLNRVELLNYVRKLWLGRSFISNSKMEDNDYNQIMIELNKRGLAGLNEAILETPCGQKGMCAALKLVTLYREAVARARLRVDATRNNNNGHSHSIQDTDSIVFHCVQGKDRTGMLAMLMQLLLGCSDEIIVEDYYQSNAEFVKRYASPSTSANHENSSAAAAAVVLNGQTNRVRMDATVFRGTNRAAMVTTLEGLRKRHGQNLDTYFDRIGFDDSWRKRFVAALGVANPASRL